MLFVGVALVPIANGVVEVATAVGNFWLNEPPDVLNPVKVVGPNGLAVSVAVLLLPTVFDVVDAVENGTK
jgi:hypothetical protein